jgi:hypothetical protein
MYDGSLDHQHSTLRKFKPQWFGPYEVRKAYTNGTYQLSDLDGTLLGIPTAGKRPKAFKKRQESNPSPILEDESNVESEQEDSATP